jgi:curved DNA-binding protein CbpA
MNKAYSTVFDISKRSVPAQLKERGFYEVKNGTGDNLPGYFFRDDASKVWTVMKKYITDAVENHYLVGQCGDDRDKFVRDDQSLQALYKDLAGDDMAGVRVRILVKFDSLIG